MSQETKAINTLKQYCKKHYKDCDACEIQLWCRVDAMWGGMPKNWTVKKEDEKKKDWRFAYHDINGIGNSFA